MFLAGGILHGCIQWCRVRRVGRRGQGRLFSLRKIWARSSMSQCNFTLLHLTIHNNTETEM